MQRDKVIIQRGMFGPSAEDLKRPTQVTRLCDLPQQLQGEAVAQILYEELASDATYNGCLQSIYTVVHSIDFYKYMDGILTKNIDIISLASREVVNACGSLGILVDPNVITNILY